MTRAAILSALALGACGPRPADYAEMIRSCTDTVAVYQKGHDRWLKAWWLNPVAVEPGADLDAICEGYER